MSKYDPRGEKNQPKEPVFEQLESISKNLITNGKEAKEGH